MKRTSRPGKPWGNFQKRNSQSGVCSAPNFGPNICLSVALPTDLLQWISSTTAYPSSQYHIWLLLFLCSSVSGRLFSGHKPANSSLRFLHNQLRSFYERSIRSTALNAFWSRGPRHLSLTYMGSWYHITVLPKWNTHWYPSHRLLTEISLFIEKEAARAFLNILFTADERISRIDQYHRRVGAIATSFQASYYMFYFLPIRNQLNN